jgi:hypothetical protein
MLKDIGTTPVKKDYAFASGDISNFMTDFGAPLQQTGVDENADLEELNQFEQEVNDEEPEPERIRANVQVSKATGKLLTIVTDSSISAIFAFVAKDGDVNAYKATPEERTELENAFTEYTRLKGTDIPPGMALMLAVGSIYGAKLPKVIVQRKNEKKE